MGTQTAQRSGWQQWKPEQAQTALAEWRASGLPLATFAKRRGISVQRLRWWRERLGDQPRLIANPGLVPAVITNLDSPAAISIHLPGGIRISVEDAQAVAPGWLLEVARGLAGRG